MGVGDHSAARGHWQTNQYIANNYVNVCEIVCVCEHMYDVYVLHGGTLSPITGKGGDYCPNKAKGNLYHTCSIHYTV